MLLPLPLRPLLLTIWSSFMVAEVFLGSAAFWFSVFFSPGVGVGDCLAEELELTAFTAVFCEKGDRCKSPSFYLLN